jgi:hypothetical protein
MITRQAVDSRLFAWALAGSMTLLSASCDDNLPPSAPNPLPSAAPLSSASLSSGPLSSTVPNQFAIEGHWEGITDQGKIIIFNVQNKGRLRNGRIKLVHKCEGEELRVKVTGLRAKVSGDTFTATAIWKIDETIPIVGEVTVSGRFESDAFARGGFVDSVTDQPVAELGDCLSFHGTWQAEKD